MEITFWGATETVTGSRFVVEAGGARILVDCGLFQGLKRLRERNWEAFPVDPASIDAVVLTHAHIDHAGYLPALVRKGFRGPIWSTPSTDALSRILLPDAAHLQEEDARYANKRRSSRHDPALPLFTQDDAALALTRFRTVPFHEDFLPASGLTARFSPAGHILGAASVWLTDGSTSTFFTGDVGRLHDPVMPPPASPLPADHVVTESTYGGRRHAATDPLDDLERVITRTVARGGSVLVPVFAVGRAQLLLHLLAELRKADRVPIVPTFLNSPMAVDATELFCDRVGEHGLTEAQCVEMCKDVELVRDVEDSKRLTRRAGPMIILSASGMATGGRVLHHLVQVAPDHRSTILLVGYQAAGTRGEALQSGARELKIFGERVPVRAEVVSIDSLSAHADGDELVEWLARTSAPTAGASIVHGEPSSADALRRSLGDELGWQGAVVRTTGETVSLR